MKRRLPKTMWMAFCAAFFLTAPAQAQNFHFDSTISKKVLENYLNRSIHYTELLHYDINLAVDRHGGNPRDNIRAILNMGAKYIGRSIMIWGGEEDLSQFTPWLNNAKRMIDTMHSVDPDIIFEAAEFEIVDQQVNLLDVPAHVLQTFGQPVVTRKFRMADIVYADGQPRGGITNVPDMSRLEARMWFYFLACNYITIGIEAVHFGQVGLMSQNDPGYTYWMDMLTKVRAYARQNARRHLILCNAHTPAGSTFVVNGRTMFDVNAFPLRMVQSGTTCCNAALQVGYQDALWGKSKGGITPSGWSCASLPWLAEFDNFGGRTPGVSSQPGTIFIWGYDEITWIAIQTEAARAAWLRYAWNWIPVNDTSAHLIMPGSRCLVNGPSNSPRWYWSNRRSTACPNGFNTEDTIKAIWGPIINTAIHPQNPAARITGYAADARGKGSVFSITGRLVKTFDIRGDLVNSNKQNYTLPKLNKGAYVYTIITPNGNVVKGKLVVTK
jgi:hypothetical protein